MKSTSYWLDIAYTPRPFLSSDIKADVVVIGAGITGVSAAYHCAKQGLKTILIEKDLIASGSAGKNGGMVVEGFALDFTEAIEEWGNLEVAKEAWFNTEKYRDYVAKLIQDYDIDCDLEQAGSIYIGLTDADTEMLRKEASVRDENGFMCEIIERDRQFKDSPFTISLSNPRDYILHPVKFVRGLASIAEEKYGLTIFENTPATSYYMERSVTTPHGTITAGKVILALETTDPNVKKEDGEIHREYGAVTEELSDEELAKMHWQIGGMLWSTGSDYITVRKIGKRLFMNGVMGFESTPENMEIARKNVLEKFFTYFPTISKDKILISHEWSGLLLYPHNYRPHIRRENGLFEIFGQGGNGLTNGIMTGKMIAESFAGEKVPKMYF